MGMLWVSNWLNPSLGTPQPTRKSAVVFAEYSGFLLQLHIATEPQYGKKVAKTQFQIRTHKNSRFKHRAGPPTLPNSIYQRQRCYSILCVDWNVHSASDLCCAVISLGLPEFLHYYHWPFHYSFVPSLIRIFSDYMHGFLSYLIVY